MTTALAHRYRPQPSRDWAEIQERMLVPLYEAVYERLKVGPHTRLLGLGCGSGLALLLAAARGATVTGVERNEQRLALARDRLLPQPQWGARQWPVRLLSGGLDRAVQDGCPAPNLVTAFDTRPSTEDLTRAAALAESGSAVVLADWGPPERCAAATALRVSARLAAPAAHTPGCWVPSGRDVLEEMARQAGLQLVGSGRVTCPFGYADMDSAVRGLLSTGFYDAAVRATDQRQVVKEVTEALHPYQREDGTVWMPNLFRYVIAHTW